MSDHCSTSCGKVCAEGVHPERLRKLAREGGRFTAQHLRALSPLRRQATLVATVLDTSTRLIDEGIALFDRAVARMFRRAETQEQSSVLRNARAVNDKIRVLAKLGTALLEAKQGGAAAHQLGIVRRFSRLRISVSRPSMPR